MKVPFKRAKHKHHDESNDVELEPKKEGRVKKVQEKREPKDPTRWIALLLFFAFLFASYVFWRG